MGKLPTYEEFLDQHPKNLDGLLVRLLYLYHGITITKLYVGNDYALWSEFTERIEDIFGVESWKERWRIWDLWSVPQFDGPWHAVQRAMELGYVEQAMQAAARLRSIGVTPV